MTLAKVEGVNGDVFIPNGISHEERSFLLETADDIKNIATDAKILIGRKLIKIKERHKNNGEFSGPKGWFIKYYVKTI